MPTTRSIWPRLILLGASLVFCVVFLEIALRVFDPIPLRVRGNTLKLSTSITTTFDNTGIPRMDRTIVVRRNSIGFRGPEVPPDYASKLTVFTVGGSTTECYYISDGKTWPDLLARRLAPSVPDLWLNNAGLDGHSTFGHVHLMQQILVPLKPKVLVFLIGINDVGALSTTARDHSLEDCAQCPASRRLLNYVTEHSDLAATGLNLLRAWRASRRGLSHRVVDLATGPRKNKVSTPAEIAALRTHHQEPLQGYRRRVQKLVDLSKSNGIAPVLVTQPALFGKGKEPVTGIQLDNVVVTDQGQDGFTAWTVLEWYNDVVREIGKTQGITVVDLARELPKNYDYFYDFTHFTNKGADTVSEIVARNLEPYLKSLPR